LAVALVVVVVVVVYAIETHPGFFSDRQTSLKFNIRIHNFYLTIFAESAFARKAKLSRMKKN